jgi:hypothetical protein
MTRASLVSLLATAALAVAPTVALAQDAGGGQYTDPLAGGGGHHSSSIPPGATASTNGSGALQSASAAGSTSSGSTSSKGSSAHAAGTSAIPRTGFPVGMLMFAGALLLCGGLALRRVTVTAST